MKRKKNVFIVITGPSGAGKTTIAKRLLKRLPNAARLVTTTTRKKRAGEKNGVDYIFVSKSSFEKMIANNELFEYAEVYGNYYGSQKATLEKMLTHYDTVIGVVDVAGARTIKKKLPFAITIFIAPESISELTERIKRRGDTDEQELQNRIQTASDELQQAHIFDKVIINKNGKLHETIDTLLSFLENAKRARYTQ